MFCEKCGKPNDDDAVFCEFCGAGFNDPAAGGQAAPAQTPVQAPAPAPVYAAAAAPKKHSKARVIAAAIALVVFMAWCVYLIFFLNKKPAKTDSYGGGVVTDNSGTSAPAQTGKPTMTVNGKNVPVDMAVLCYGEIEMGAYGYMATFASKTDDELFMLQVFFLEEPKSNTTINGYENNDNFPVFTYSGKDLGINKDGYYNADEDAISTEFSVEIGKFVPNKYIEVTVSAKAEIDDKTYNIKADGKLNFDDTDPYEKIMGWFRENRIPAH